ncbi:F0F1 ATP synthase subunit A [Candidatus Dependentiae bacterium]|nr:F0F1 ATP synthase subunit A [Candidatus Dependentiae bacterium]
MEGFNLLEQSEWHFFGLTFNAHTIINTWAAIAVILIFIVVSRFFLQKPNSIIGYLIKKFIISFMDLVEQSIGKFTYKYFAFTASLFIFIITCNWIALIPELEEPTKDLNTTLALAIVTFLYIQIQAIKEHGVIDYIKHYFSPFAPMVVLNIVSELATILSLSFRLFGNIFGGAIIATMYHKAVSGSVLLHTITTITGIPLIIAAFFILFEGFLQAFVFSILSLTNLAMAVSESE